MSNLPAGGVALTAPRPLSPVVYFAGQHKTSSSWLLPVIQRAPDLARLAAGRVELSSREKIRVARRVPQNGEPATSAVTPKSGNTFAGFAITREISHAPEAGCQRMMQHSNGTTLNGVASYQGSCTAPAGPSAREAGLEQE